MRIRNVEIDVEDEETLYPKYKALLIKPKSNFHYTGGITSKRVYTEWRLARPFSAA